ncbi:cysteine proteinase [Phanerochaete sordida]|uniref:ubiquitinyl hydrolase 1 n=1 Tax=Phanerochaete sordida TaxID=48140 RepID=A0A9P3GFM6_9APHY|nr:cysteine proteinase [Phanerochaete sordida]
MSAVDLIGEPFTVIESDPGVFTILLRKLGLRHLEVTEFYSIEPWATAHLERDIRGLILCYPCPADTQKDRPALDFEEELPDPDAEDVWFAHQLSVDACASQTILNVGMNIERLSMSSELRAFYDDTLRMDPLMKGLALTNCSFIREAHNSMARPADVRAAEHLLATTTLDYAKSLKARPDRPPPKRRKVSSPKKSSAKQSVDDDALEAQDTFHYIGFVPAHGHVWELDGLRASGPLDVGELPNASSAQGWMDVVRPALQRRMEGAGGMDGRYSLLAIVDDRFEKASDALEMLKRERAALERRLNELHPGTWRDVDMNVAGNADDAFATSVQPSAPGRTFAQDFGSRKMEQDVRILDMPERNLMPAWEACVRNAREAKRGVEEEVAAAKRANTEHINRTHDYEDFFRTFVGCMQREGVLDDVLSTKKEPANPT